MNPGNSNGPETHRLFLDPSGKKELKKSDKYVTLSNLSIEYT